MRTTATYALSFNLLLWIAERIGCVIPNGEAAYNWRQHDLPTLEIGFAIHNVGTSNEL